MKKYNIYILLALFTVVSITSCKKFLDINKNPNNPTVSTPELVLPQAIVRSATLPVSFNSYGARLVGYQANAGGVSGWGAFVSYDYTTSDFGSLFEATYKANEDLELVAQLSAKDADHNAFIAAARIMQAFNWQTLVDTYNDVPYFDALKGTGNLQPKYDKAEDIYKALADSLDFAIVTLKATATSTAFKNSDPMFKGDIASWIKLANTIKLRLIVRGGSKVAFTNTNFDPAGFVTADVMVNPGYTKIDGKQNPTWNTWAYTAAGSAASGASQRIPTPFALAFFDGTKMDDAKRANLFYKNGLTVPKNQLGYQESDAAKGIAPSVWFIGTDDKTYTKIGILKGPDAPQPIMLASESFFLQAQANVRGIAGVGGTALENFKKGVFHSFNYLEKDNTGAIPTGRDVKADTTTYFSLNNTNRLVNFELATTDEQKIEAIVSQQYVAYNQMFGHQTWFEYIRTGYPVSTGAVTQENAKRTMVSLVSVSTAPDNLPTRILYPASEFKYNDKNIPVVNKFSSKIFYAR